MKISIGTTHVLSAYGIDEGMRLIKESGFEAIDLSLTFLLPWGVLDLDKENKYETMSEEELREAVHPYKEAAEKYGIEIAQAHAIYPTYHKTQKGQERIDNLLKRNVMLCGYLGCPRLVIHPGERYYAEQMTEQEAWDYNIRMYANLIPELKKYHVIACLENIFLGYRGKYLEGVCTTAEEINLYVDTLNQMAGEKCFGFCWDSGHSLVIGKDVGKMIHMVGSHLEALHLHDNDGVEDLHIMPYTGKLDWERVAQSLGDIGYKGTINFEVGFSNIPKEIYPQALAYVAATGRYMEKIISGKNEDGSKSV